MLDARLANQISVVQNPWHAIGTTNGAIEPPVQLLGHALQLVLGEGEGKAAVEAGGSESAAKNFHVLKSNNLAASTHAQEHKV